MLALFCCVHSNAQNNPYLVKYLPPGMSDDRQVYEEAVIRAALEATVETHGAYQFEYWLREDMSPLRSMRELARGELINVSTNPLSSELVNSQLSIIPIPLMKGLLGYRALVVRDSDVERLSSLSSLDEVRDLKLGQLDYWFDVAVYQANGFDVIKGSNMDVLFTMLKRGRFDYIPLGIGEVDKILSSEKAASSGLTVLPNTYLYYPFPVYTYVCDCEPKLSARLEKGLRIISENGTLEAMFTKRFGEAFEKTQHAETRIFKIENKAIPNRLLPSHSSQPSSER